MATINSTNRLADKLLKIMKSMDTTGHPRVSVGFLRDASYPDGTPVALVAAVQEFGSGPIPPRPFFRLMVAEKRGEWPKTIGDNLKATDYDAHKTLDRMGQVVKAELQDSIKTMTDPPLAPATIKRKGFDKLLIDTGHMLNSVDYRVED